jgi:hypothetical protein
MRKIVPAALALLLSVASLAGAETWTGWITDSHCGKGKARAGVTADQIDMCVKGGATWQVWSEKDQKGLDVDDPAKLRPFTGKKVVVTGTLDAKANRIKLEKVEPVAQN